MKNKISLVLILTLLSTGCASRDDDGNIIYDENGEEEVSGWRTSGAIVAGLAVATGVVLMARNSHKWNGGSSNAGSSHRSLSCECPDDIDIAGKRCGNRSAYSRTGGREFSPAYCSAKLNSYTNDFYSPPQVEKCECPDDLDSSGNKCGNRSAMIRTNGSDFSKEYCNAKSVPITIF